MKDKEKLMIYNYGERSSKRLDTCSFNVQYVMQEAIAMGLIDITIIEGQRPDEKQHEYFLNGSSRVDVGNPKAMHNYYKPSKAVDAAPYIDGTASSNWRHCIFLAGVVLTVGKKLGIPMRWGGNWDMDGEPITDQDFQDLWHFEEAEKE